MSKIVSYSEVFKKQTCDRQYYYRFVLGRRPIVESGAIDTGIKGHKLMQIFNECIAANKSKDEALAVVRKKAKEIAEASFTPDFNLLTALTLVENYVQSTEFNIEALFIEKRFLLPASKLSKDPFFEDVMIGFTPDVVFQRTGNFLDVEDFKFVQRAWTKKKIDRFPQCKLYQVFLEAMGFKVSFSRIRFFNTKTGVVTFQNYTIKDAERKILIRDFMHGVKETIQYREQPAEVLAQSPRTMNYTTCAGCYFNFPCTLEGEGKNVTRILETEFEKSEYDYNV
jgi:hypothetical protein